MRFTIIRRHLMNYKIVLILIAAFFCKNQLTARIIHQAFELPEGSTLYSNIKELHLKSCKVESSLKADLSTVLLTEQQKLDQLILVFDLFSRNERAHKQTPTLLITPLDSIDNLNIFCGNKSKPKHTLLAQVTRTTTQIGLAYFSRLLAQPIDDVKTLTNRQALIYALLDDNALFAQLKLILNELAAAEPHLLALWQSPEKSGKSVKDAGFYYQPEYYYKWSTALGQTVEGFNESTRALDFKAHHAKIAVTLALTGIIFQGIKSYSDWKTNKDGLLENSTNWNSMPTISGTFNFLKFAGNIVLPFITIPGALWVSAEAYPKDSKDTADAFKNSGNKINSIKIFLHNMHQLTHIIENNPVLMKNLILFSHLSNLVKPEGLPDKLLRLKELLASPELKNNKEFNPSGKALLAYKLLDEISAPRKNCSRGYPT